MWITSGGAPSGPRAQRAELPERPAHRAACGTAYTTAYLIPYSSSTAYPEYTPPPTFPQRSFQIVFLGLRGWIRSLSPDDLNN